MFNLSKTFGLSGALASVTSKLPQSLRCKQSRQLTIPLPALLSIGMVLQILTGSAGFAEAFTNNGTRTAAAPVADFAADVTAGQPPLKVNFTDNSSGSITSWEWDFGDGEISTEQNPSHTYNDFGIYTVSLTVTGTDGSDTETKSDYITAATILLIPKDGDWASSINALKPGDIGQLETGRYLGINTITVSGTADKPIIIRGAGHLESIFDGESGNRALRLDGCSNLIIENITVTNPSPIGIDGRENYSSLARNRLPERDPGYSTLAEGIIIRGGGSRITIRRSLFVDIATRGIFVGSGGVDDLTVEHNIFIRISDDTAGGDVAAGSSATRMTVRENLMAGNVDGIVTDGAGAGHIFERNIVIFHKWEDGMDIKRTWKRKDEGLWTIIRNNVFYSRLNRYSAISIQFGSDYVKVLGNVFHGTGSCETILIRGRNGSEGIEGNVENHEIVGNWFDYKPGYNDSGYAFRIHQYTADPSDIRNVYILHNVFTGGHRLGGMTHGSNLNVYNNIFESTTLGGVAADVDAGTNLYHNTAVWGIDTDPIVGEPVYTENPVGPLAEGSPGKGRATILRGYDLGNDVGLPQSTENLVKLEISIMQSLEEHFTYEEIKEAMVQGSVCYDDDGDMLFDLWEKYYFGSPAACDPNADPDNDGIANLEEYANGTDPLNLNSIQ